MSHFARIFVCCMAFSYGLAASCGGNIPKPTVKELVTANAFTLSETCRLCDKDLECQKDAPSVALCSVFLREEPDAGR